MNSVWSSTCSARWWIGEGAAREAERSKTAGLCSDWIAFAGKRALYQPAMKVRQDQPFVKLDVLHRRMLDKSARPDPRNLMNRAAGLILAWHA